jgi:hypothetical protein
LSAKNNGRKLITENTSAANTLSHKNNFFEEADFGITEVAGKGISFEVTLADSTFLIGFFFLPQLQTLVVQHQ